MCGIIGIVGNKQAEPVLIEGLKRLEYRGYDSAGVATIHDDTLLRARVQGKIRRLEERLSGHHLQGTIGIGHTRWATHGAPTDANAHPHVSERVAVVHNGIIENHSDLRDSLKKKGYVFTSETDTEVVPFLLEDALKSGLTPEQAVLSVIKQLHGAYALAILFTDMPETLFAARLGSPLAIGYGDGFLMLGSDAVALSPFVTRASYLEEGDCAMLTAKDAVFYDREHTRVTREIKTIAAAGSLTDKGNFPHFMLKEIYEQPDAVAATIHNFYDATQEGFSFGKLTDVFAAAAKISMVACGTSFYAAQVARYWFEQIAKLPASIDIASEFRYRQPLLPKGGIGLFISQSGETADTLAALRHSKSEGQYTVGLVNVPESTISREADSVLYTLAGTEIGVASTKAFNTQLAALACLTLSAARERGVIDAAAMHSAVHAFTGVPEMMHQVLALDQQIHKVAEDIYQSRSMIFIGRGTGYPIACEGALKMKEISYIHAEGYAAGELKHGPLALIDQDMPVVVVAPEDALFEKTASNLQEVAARGGKIILLSSEEGARKLKSLARHVITLPECDVLAAPILYATPLQLLAYHTAVLRGNDVDQPRNLAKSVTVE
ncbi:MAG: glutamine--fructose-6-phosphate transaminase (isomerizing) [Rickettsiales bacterium]